MYRKQSKWLIAGVLAVVTAASGPAMAQQENELLSFEVEPDLVYINLPVKIDGEIVGSLRTGIADIELSRVDRASWLRIATGHFVPDLIESILQAAPEGQIPVEVFMAHGVGVIFDANMLEVHFELQESHRLTRAVALKPGEVDYSDLSRYDLPANSGYLNFNLEQEYRRGGEVGGAAGQASLANLSGAVQLLENPRLVLEGAALYDSLAGSGGRWSRGEARLVHDDIEHAVRYGLGDIYFRATEFQASPPLLGISIERAFDEIQPLRQVTPTGTRSFAVNQRSIIDVYVNGVFQDTLRLDAGRYNLSDFAFNAGVNDVVLVITDPSGNERRIEFSLFSDPRLLQQGMSEFSFNVGYRRDESLAPSIEYDESAPLVSGFYRLGVSDTLTFGASYQGHSGHHVAGTDLTYSSALGLLSGNLSYSDAGQSGAGTAASMRWSYDFFASGETQRPHELDLVAVVREGEYLPIGQVLPEQGYRSEYRARYTAPGPWDTFLSGSVRYAQRFAESESPERLINLDINRRFGRTNLALRLEHDPAPDGGARALVRMSMPLGGRQQLSSRWNSFDDASELSWGRFQREVVGDLSGAAALRSDGTTRNADLEAYYVANRFEAGIEHRWSGVERGSEPAVNVTRLRLGSSLAFAGGSVGVGRPIDDSFIMVKRHPSLQGSRVRVDERQDGYSAFATDWGPAVLPRVDSYITRPLRWEAENPPFGYDMGNVEGNSFPFYRSGLVYVAGSAASVTAVGTARDASGNAVAMTMGTIDAVDDREFEPVTTFTNRDGRFVAQSLSPGKYRLSFPGQSGLTLYFEIGDESLGMVELGVLKGAVKI